MNCKNTNAEKIPKNKYAGGMFGNLRETIIVANKDMLSHLVIDN